MAQHLEVQRWRLFTGTKYFYIKSLFKDIRNETLKLLFIYITL